MQSASVVILLVAASLVPECMPSMDGSPNDLDQVRSLSLDTEQCSETRESETITLVRIAAQCAFVSSTRLLEDFRRRNEDGVHGSLREKMPILGLLKMETRTQLLSIVYNVGNEETLVQICVVTRLKGRQGTSMDCIGPS